MNNFQEQLAIDNKNIIYNTAEFALSIKWNGHALIVVDETPTESTQFTHGITSETVIYRCAIDSLNPSPEINERVDINGNFWMIVSIQKLTNDFVIRLERLRP